MVPRACCGKIAAVQLCRLNAWLEMGGPSTMTATQQEHHLVHSTSTDALDDRTLLAALRNGDEYAFVHLLDRYGGMMIRLALIYVPSRAVAEEVVQETWLAVFQGLSRFEERSSLKTWILRILTNRAKTRGEREGRSVPFSTLEGRDLDPEVLSPIRNSPCAVLVPISSTKHSRSRHQSTPRRHRCAESSP